MTTINGTIYDDTLKGGGAADAIYGGNGNDTLKGSGGADYLEGGAGIDTATYIDSGAGVAVNLATGYNYGGTADGDVLVGVENVYGSAYNDYLVGDWRDNVLTGQSGNDVLKGGGGNDTLDGGEGNDILRADWGAEVFIGGNGNDTVDYRDSINGVSVSLGDPFPWWAFPNRGDQFIGVENLTGSDKQDVLVGDGDANVLKGLGGADNLVGGAGNDTMSGGTGDDAYYVDDPGDVVWEYAGEGTYDHVITSVSYTLLAGSEIEQLETEDFYGAVNLTATNSTTYHRQQPTTSSMAAPPTGAAVSVRHLHRRQTRRSGVGMAGRA